MKNKTKTIEIFEGDRVQNYDAFIEELFPSYHLFIKAVPRILGQRLLHKEQPRLLVVGCGTGNEAKHLAQYSTKWQIDACDPSEEMYAFAKAKLAPYPNTEVMLGMVNALDHRKTYYAATLFLVLHFLSDDGAKLALLNDIAAKLKKGGLFILFDISGSKEEISDTFEIQKALFPAHWTQEKIAERKKRITQNLNVISEERCFELLEEAGFDQPIRFHQHTICKGWMATKK